MDAEKCFRCEMLVLSAVILISVTHTIYGDSVTQPPAPPTSNQGYFNATSHVTINSVIDLQKHIVFSFRTCGYGQILHQQGGRGEMLRIGLTQNGSLELSSRESLNSSTDYSLIGEDTLRDNQWYTVDVKFNLGEIVVLVERGGAEIFHQVVSNSTHRRYMWDLDLSGGSRLQVGSGFVGCIQGGPSVNLTAPDNEHKDVLWGECPLDQQLTGCGEPEWNSCWEYPCLNGGSCVHIINSYVCNCPVQYTGHNCETDIGSLGCGLEPCENNSTCENKPENTRKYDCKCQAGFTGVNCQINIDECAPTPCQNEGRCIDLVNDFRCQCNNTGYSGSQCTEDEDECILSPCQNEAACTNTPGSYKCTCTEGWEGKNCERTDLACESNPCRNSGTCVDLVGSYSCQCTPGYTGDMCQVDIDDCVNVTCHINNTHCVDGVDSYTCLCQPGFYDVDPGEEMDCWESNECDSAPCINGGTCEDLVNAFRCTCPPGYTGAHCQEEINECQPNPCQHGANCTDLLNGFHCDCVEGYTDVTCSVNIDDCQLNPCNHGQCNDLVNGYNCSCFAGYAGEHCNLDLDECSSSPCMNGASCTNEFNKYTCLCQAGFTGVNCEDNIDDCDPDPCLNAAPCVDRINDYYCNCTSDWMGKICNQTYNACAFSPCQNEAACQTTPPSHDYTCDCVPGFTGSDCETNIDDCVDHTCPNHTVCVDRVQNYTCECRIGFKGRLCDEEILECASDPCVNGAKCSDGVGNYTCDCLGKIVNLTEYTNDPRYVYRTGYEGVNCELDIDECDLDPPMCLNDGICVNKVGTYECKCGKDGRGKYFSGDNCEVGLDKCDHNRGVCKNGATCVPSATDFTCTCAPGYTGDTCNGDINECDSSPCAYNGTCTDHVNHYSCACIPGITGANCETNVDECVSGPCLSGGQCIDRINGFVCNCTDTGFNGTNCELNIDDCASNPCLHGSVCSDGIKGYTCSCLEGYTGPRCETDLDECESNPCQNNATCWQRSNQTREGFNYSTAAGYNCQCQPGFEGIHCEMNIDECLSNPCIHGDCSDRIAGFTCHCNQGYEGTNCELEINECIKYSPCQNGAKCMDKINNYSCGCVEHGGLLYGGRNCTVELVGCHSPEDNKCENGAKCVPYLVSEQTDTHNYTCSCLSGYYGVYCGTPTSATFSGESYMYSNAIRDRTTTVINARFRTTLPDALLLYSSNNDGYMLSVYLYAGRTIKLEYVRSGLSVEAEVGGDGNLNNAQWQDVTVNINSDNVSLILNNCEGRVCEDSGNVTGVVGAIGAVYIGGAPTEIMRMSNVCPNLIGCMQDVVLGSEWIIPEDTRDQQVDVVPGCNRTDQCNPDPCNARGQCTDLWTRFKCECRRPYMGDTCSQSYPTATFGAGGQKSRAVFKVPQSRQEAFKTTNHISFFFRTRASNGGMMHIHGDTTGSGYMSVWLDGGRLAVTFGGEGEEDTLRVGYALNDGQQHGLLISRKNRKLTVTVDNMTVQQNLTRNYQVLAEEITFGSKRLVGASRKKREIEIEDVLIRVKREEVDLLSADDSAKFTITDARVNDLLLQFLRKNDSETSNNTLLSDTVTNVQEGVVSDDVCDIIEPCDNNATCHNVGFDDFFCNCTEDWRGRNCSQYDFCGLTSCPGLSKCNSLQDGHECVSAGTFNGTTDMIQYIHNLTSDVDTISLQFRTRAVNGVIFHVRGGTSHQSKFITIEMVDKHIQVKYNLADSSSTIESAPSSDGNWHYLQVTVASDQVSLKIDDNITTSSSTQTITLTDLMRDTEDTFVGGVTRGYYLSNPAMMTSDVKFKGCLDSVRIGGVLLPFYTPSQLGVIPTAEQFVVQSISVSEGCHGDPVCDDNGCRSNSTCRDIWNDYQCDCLPGFNGRYCQTNIDECLRNNCTNGATCVDGINGYTCKCVVGYIGERCAEVQDNCNVNGTSPCYNNATCHNIISDGNYTCNCTDGFTGDNCQITIVDSCNDNLCMNNATCHNETTSDQLYSNCTCSPGYTGRYCDDEIDYCNSTSEACLNGNCTSHLDLLNFTCSCYPGYTGHRCDVDIDDCVDSPCANGGQCIDGVNNYTCNCTSGWTGYNCTEDINECETISPCENNGTCTNNNGSYHCQCPGTHRGKNCEEEINICTEADPCQNSGKCIPTDTGGVAGYICNCTLGYDGVNCSNPNCSHDNCDNNGNCTTSGGIWSCTCPEFTSGNRCETVGPCFTSPCKNQATCAENGGDYHCTCFKGWEGKNCTDDIDECDRGICQNNATCLNWDGSYNCTCQPGFLGLHCTEEQNACEPDPCNNGGTCVNGRTDFTCNCQPGFTGKDCSVNIDDCRNDSCQNGGTCVDLINGFNCSCPETHIGSACHLQNPCMTSPCQNAGTCTPEIDTDDTKATYSCQCSSSHEGPNCERVPVIEKSQRDPIELALIIAFPVAAFIIISAVVLVAVVSCVRKKRATGGTYYPSRQELNGVRTELKTTLTIPPQERLV